jgi:hypothetical protein
MGVSPSPVTKTMMQLFPITTRHMKTNVGQPVFHEGTHNGLKIATNEADNRDTRADQGGFERVRDGAAYENIHMHARYFTGPSEGVPVLQEHVLPSYLFAVDRFNQAQPVRDIEKG